MHPHDPSDNGGVPPKPELFEMELEPVDPNELNLDNIPTVEAVREVEPVKFQKPGFGFWKAVLWCLLFIGVSQVLPAIIGAFIIIVGAIVASIFGEEVVPKDPAAFMSSPLLQMCLQISIFIGHVFSIGFSVFVMRRKLGPNWPKKIAFHRPSLEHVILVLVGLPALLMTLVPIEQFAKQLLRNWMDLDEMISQWPISIAVLLIGIGPAIGEELWFRGFLGQGVAARYGRWHAILIVSVLFGLVHGNPLQAIVAMMLGVILHLTYVATRSILIPMMLHFLNNTLAVLSVKKSLPFLDSLAAAYEMRPLLALTSASLVLGIVGFLLYRSRARIVTPEGTESAQYLRSHVELPVKSGRDRVESSSLTVVEIGLLIVLVGFFVAVWFGI